MSDRFGGNVDAEVEVPTGSQFGTGGEKDLAVDFYGDEPASDHLPHISKSRIKTFLKCPRKFAYKYLAGERASENFYMRRGTHIHDAFEEYHHNLKAFVAANQTFPASLTDLMGPATEWFEFIDWIGPFFDWELQRYETARANIKTKHKALGAWTPHSLEKSLTIEDPPVGDLPWLGPYDALLDARSVREIKSNEGYVVVDYKTGKLPKKEYRDSGIHVDLEFYAWMLEQEGFNVAGAIGMYPTADGNVVRSMPNEQTRDTITEVIEDLHELAVTRSDFEINEQPLCDWCDYQPQCPSTWDY
jgi:RecB family exonuclease